MGGYGFRNDVNNSISNASAYPGGRTYGMTAPAATRYSRRNNSMGELMAVNQGTGVQAGGQPRSAASAAQDHNGITGRPVGWWLTIVVLLVAIIWLMKRFAPAESREFGNIQPGLYNGVFLALYLVIILSVLKVIAGKIQKFPGLRTLSDLLLAI